MGTRTVVAVGLAICVLAAGLMLANVIDVGWGSTLGAIGVGVITAPALRRDRAADCR